MQEFLNSKKPLLSKTLESFLSKVALDASKVSLWSSDLSSVLYDYATRGKMIRGSLVSLGLTAFKAQPTALDSELALSLGAVMELLQAMLLIHDDIMDQDDFRRNAPAVHFHYAERSRMEGLAQHRRLGESLGICMGDVSGFLAFEIISHLNLSGPVLQKVLYHCSRELAYVGLAQMDDVRNGYIEGEVALEDIFKLYRYKTGRYTFSLPLMLGAILAGASDTDVELVGKLGEEMGIIFQIKDDELGLFGTDDQTGKPQGSDILENKKTPYRMLLLESLPGKERIAMRESFGQPGLQKEQIIHILSVMQQVGVIQKIEAILDDCTDQVNRCLNDLHSLNSFGRSAMESLLRYNLERKW